MYTIVISIKARATGRINTNYKYQARAKITREVFMTVHDLILELTFEQKQEYKSELAEIERIEQDAKTDLLKEVAKWQFSN